MYICIYYDVIIYVYTVCTYVYSYTVCIYVYIMLCADLFTALHVLGFCLPSTSSSASLVAWGMWATDT